MTTSIFISLAPISLAQDFPLLVNYLRQKLQEMGVKGCSLLVWCCQDFFKALCPFSTLNLSSVVVPAHSFCCAVERGI